jgi:hemerythrin
MWLNMSLVWSDGLASGSEEIDNQHKELITRANRLLATFEGDGMNRQEISKIIDYLTDYVVFHFGTEEKYMDRSLALT